MQTGGLSPAISCVLIVWAATGYVYGADTFCAYSKQSVVKFSSLEKSSDDDGESESFVTGELLNGNLTEKCPPSSKFCYALWQEDFVNKNITVLLAQGCWESAAEFDCSEGECISNKRPPKALNNTKFCCCVGNKCNENVSDGFISFEDVEPAPRYVEHASYDTQTVIIAVATMCSLAVIIMLAACITYHMCSATQKPSPDSVYLMEAPPPSSPTFNIDNLKIRESIGRGRYGHVYRGTLYNQTVAVKIFSSQNRQNYVSERYIYCLPFMDHSCLPKLIGAEEHVAADDRPEYLLVLSYAPKGCLQDYLSNNTIDWATFCKMAQTVTQGLAHLHTEIRKDTKLKMCIAHRDLTSRNILMKADGSCMLCDFGFAICISGSKYYVNGEEQVAEATSLTDVGTLRYMAPEVLEGAVNLRDCESSLKQIDVYALGLILWEIATRCVDLFQGVEVPEYKLPFTAEIGPHPSMEQIQVLVARHKARPLFPDIWKDTNPAVRALKETIEDCWDQDAEARLTALCVEERLMELPVLWDRHKAGSTIQGVSPTVNPTSTQQQSGITRSTIQSSANTWYKGPSFELPVIKSNVEVSSPNNGPCGSRYSAECSLSENTAETSITMSPCELTPKSCPSYSSNSGSNMKNLSANNNVAPSCLRVTVPLQPYQGKNPIMERNLIMDPVEEVAISGNSLVEKRDKYSSGSGVANGFHFESELFNAFQPGETSESNALVSNDMLSQTVRACNPIPYVQNAVHVTSTMPKQPNVPGNGHALHGNRKETEKKKKNEERKLMSGLKNFFKFPWNSRNSHTPEQTSTPTPPINIKVNVAPSVNVPKFHNAYNSVTRNGNLVNANCSTDPKQGMETEVYLMDPDDDFSMTQTIVRPVANKQVCCQDVPSDSITNIDTVGNNNFSFVNGFGQSQTHPFLSSESKDTPARDFPNTDSINAFKRPSTLPVAKFGSRKNYNFSPDINFDKHSQIPIIKNDTFHSENAVSDSVEETNVKEVKTQSNLQNGRLSLYDDRIMASNSDLRPQPEGTLHNASIPKISCSVPQFIDSLCESEVSNFHHTCQNQKKQNLEDSHNKQL